MDMVAALGAGIVSFFSPCTWPLIPIYILYLTGTSDGSSTRPMVRWQAFTKGLAFILGFAAVFVLLGTLAGLGSKFLFTRRYLVQQASAIFIIAAGIYLTGIIRLPFLYREKGIGRVTRPAGLIPAFFLGMAFATGWTPCTGPILAAILAYVAGKGTAAYGTYLLALYALGLALPFLVMALFLDYLGGFRRFMNRLMPYISPVAGVALIIAGVLLYFGWLY
ncbi:MAG: sulfite exporter TauE/SafE family protein [Clostridia bacterium]|nr:sulfite exporter TauE/SafE family protein [Clostridia bacterium]